MGAWQMGVAVKVTNHSFRFGSRYSDTLAAGVSIGATTLTVTTSTQQVAVGDYLVLGPNSSGSTEVVVVESINRTTKVITVDAAVTNAYASGNYVTGYTTNLAGGWTVGGDGSENIPKGTVAPRISDDVNDPAPGRGYDFDRYAQKVDLSGWTTNTKYLQQSLDADDFETSATYRLGFYYKLKGGSTPTCSVIV